MKAEFLIENVEGFLSLISKTLPIHSQIPILSNILIEATSSGLYIYSTNLEMGTKIKVPAKIEEEGATTVPGKQFLEALSSLPKDKVSIIAEKGSLTLVCRGNKIVFQTVPRDEFPTIYEEMGEKVHVFKTSELKDIFSKVIFSSSPDESRPELTGVLILQDADRTDFVATDGFRLSIKSFKSKILNDEDRLIIPVKVISEVLSLKTEDEITLHVYREANQVIFETGNVLLVGRLIDGDFPNYTRVIPASGKTTIVVDREELSQSLKLSSIFARDSANIIHIKIEAGKMKIVSKSSGLGEGEAVIEVDQKGDDNEIAFNIRFVSDLLKNTNSKTISMQINSPVEPALFKTDDDSELIHVIMPVRVTD